MEKIIDKMKSFSKLLVLFIALSIMAIKTESIYKANYDKVAPSCFEGSCTSVICSVNRANCPLWFVALGATCGVASILSAFIFTWMIGNGLDVFLWIANRIIELLTPEEVKEDVRPKRRSKRTTKQT